MLPDRPAWPVVLLSFAVSWVCWVPAAWLGRSGRTLPASLLTILGGFGPSLAGLIVVGRELSSAQRRDWWGRVVDPRRIDPRSYAVILLLFPASIGVSSLLDPHLHGRVPEFPALTRLRAQPMGLVPLLLVGIVAGPLSEELGWRGVVLDRLLARWTVARSGLVLGSVWALWHLPLFFIPGTMQHKRGVGTPHFWLFFPNVIALSVVITRIYVETRRSILGAILTHLASNLTTTVCTPLPASLEARRVALVSLVALVLVGPPWTSSPPKQPTEAA